MEPLENIEFLDFCKTSFFLSTKHSLLSRISKNALFWIDLPKKHRWQKVPFFDKNHGLTPLENFEFLDFSIKKRSFLDWFAPKTQMIKSSFFLTMDVWKISIFWSFLKLPFSGLKSNLFYPEHKKRSFLSTWFAPKTKMITYSIFWLAILRNFIYLTFLKVLFLV